MDNSDLMSPKQIINLLKVAIDLGLTTPSGGNVSIKNPDNTISITPSGLDKYLLKPSQITHLSKDGQHLSGPPPTSEVPFHLALMKANDVNCVLHLHAPMLSALSTLPDQLICQFFSHPLPQVSPIPYAEPGSKDQASIIREQADTQSRHFLLKNHGMVIAAQSLQEAINELYLLEQLTSIALEVGLSKAPGFTYLKLSTFDHNEVRFNSSVIKRAIKYKLLLPMTSSWHYKAKRINYHKSFYFDSDSRILIKELASTGIGIQKEIRDWAERLFIESNSINSMAFCQPVYLMALLSEGLPFSLDYIAETYIVIKGVAVIKELPDDQTELFRQVCDLEVSVLLWKDKGAIILGKSQSELLDRILVAENSAKIAIKTKGNTEIERISADAMRRLANRYH